MAVHLTRIYTKTGDGGTTALGDLSRVPKTDPRVGAYADCDETNAAIGVALALGVLPEPVAAVLRTIQNELFDVGADLCTPIHPNPPGPAGRTPPSAPLRVTSEYTGRLENWCDQFNEELAPLNSFILPGGTPGAALLHQCRTLARRAERSAWALYEADAEHTNREALLYLNRLSDLLFILSRVANPGGDVLWRPAMSRDSVR
jgi:cob(I)alamin adenosyltransferase